CDVFLSDACAGRQATVADGVEQSLIYLLDVVGARLDFQKFFSHGVFSHYTGIAATLLWVQAHRSCLHYCRTVCIRNTKLRVNPYVQSDALELFFVYRVQYTYKQLFYQAETSAYFRRKRTYE